jgi:hypothetical protein
MLDAFVSNVRTYPLEINYCSGLFHIADIQICDVGDLERLGNNIFLELPHVNTVGNVLVFFFFFCVVFVKVATSGPLKCCPLYFSGTMDPWPTDFPEAGSESALRIPCRPEKV